MLRDERTNDLVKQAPYHVAMQEIFSTQQRCVLWGHVEMGKALPIDTPIPTPSGFVKMGDLAVGDEVFDQDGLPQRVTFVTPVMYGHECFRIKFSDGGSIVADADHQWSAWHPDDPMDAEARVVTTRELGARWMIPALCHAAQYAAEPLPIARIEKEVDALYGGDAMSERLLTARKRDRELALSRILDKGPLKLLTEQAASSIAELVRSLGYTAHVTDRQNVLGGGSPWRGAHGSWAVEPFAVDRRSVVHVTPVKSVPVRCISVEGYTQLYLAGRDYTVTHNTQQLIARILWEIGKNPSIRILYVQVIKDNAMRVSQTVKSYIEGDANYHRIFPHVKPGESWQDSAWAVERPHQIVHPTFQPVGYGGKVTTNRVDLLIIDDIIELSNALTALRRSQVHRYVEGVLLNRLTPGARTWWVGNAWHVDDAMHRRAKLNSWFSKKFPVRDPETGKPIWWSEERIQEVCDNIGNPIEIARVLDCVPRSDDAGGFQQAWIDNSLEMGAGIFGDGLVCMGFPGGKPRGWTVFVGVDLAVSVTSRADKTAFFIFAVRPDGKKVILRVWKGRWSGVEIMRNLALVNKAYGPRRIYVESVAAQDHIRQFMRDPAIMAAATGDPEDVAALPVLPFKTRGQGTVANKHHGFYGIQGLFTEWSAGVWITPCVITIDEDTGVATTSVDPDIAEFLQSMLYYSSEDHTPDDLMAAWIGNEGCRSTGGLGRALVLGDSAEPEKQEAVISRREAAGDAMWQGLMADGLLGDRDDLLDWDDEPLDPDDVTFL